MVLSTRNVYKIVVSSHGGGLEGWRARVIFIVDPRIKIVNATGTSQQIIFFCSFLHGFFFYARDVLFGRLST